MESKQQRQWQDIIIQSLYSQPIDQITLYKRRLVIISFLHVNRIRFILLPKLWQEPPNTVNFTSSRVLTPQLHLILHVVVAPKIFLLISSKFLHFWCTCLPVERYHNICLWCCLFLESRLSSYKVIGSYILGVRLWTNLLYCHTSR